MTDFFHAWLLWCVFGLANIIIISALQERKHPGQIQRSRDVAEPDGPWTNLAWIAAALMLWPILLYGYLLGAGDKM